jgi:hypothetical protein
LSVDPPKRLKRSSWRNTKTVLILTDFPDGWFGYIDSEELEIDEIEKV